MFSQVVVQGGQQQVQGGQLIQTQDGQTIIYQPVQQQASETTPQTIQIQQVAQQPQQQQQPQTVQIQTQGKHGVQGQQGKGNTA